MANLKVDASKLKRKLQSQSPINDLIFTGVSQFLGTSQGPLEVHIPGLPSIFRPSTEMIKFLCELEILIPDEEVKTEKADTLLHS